MGRLDKNLVGSQMGAFQGKLCLMHSRTWEKKIWLELLVELKRRFGRLKVQRSLGPIQRRSVHAVSATECTPPLPCDLLVGPLAVVIG